MNEEEKKAINELKEYTDSYVWVKNHFENLDKKDYMEKHPIMEAIIIILSLVEKQKEELEDYKSGYFFTAKQMHFIDEDYIAKDKIKDKIKEIEKWDKELGLHTNYAISVLKELLEE